MGGTRESGDSDWPLTASLIVLSGGTSRRLGRDKATVHMGGRSLVARILEQVPQAVPVVVVGPPIEGLPDRVARVREEPPGSGPLAGIGAGMAEIHTPLVGVLAVDMPFAAPLVAGALGRLAGAAAEVSAVVPVDPDGRGQPLAAAYRTGALGSALTGLGPIAGLPVRAVLGTLRVMEWDVPAHDLADVDTELDLRAARRRAAAEGSEMDEWVRMVLDALGVQVDVDLDVILDVARDAAHGVERPAAPVTTYLLGAAVARGADPVKAAAAISALAADWSGGDG